jgi:hypothetical protein
LTFCRKRRIFFSRSEKKFGNKWGKNQTKGEKMAEFRLIVSDPAHFRGNPPRKRHNRLMAIEPSVVFIIAIVRDLETLLVSARRFSAPASAEKAKELIALFDRVETARKKMLKLQKRGCLDPDQVYALVREAFNLLETAYWKFPDGSWFNGIASKILVSIQLLSEATSQFLGRELPLSRALRARVNPRDRFKRQPVELTLIQ